MKIIIRIAAIFAFAFGAQANALTITPGDADYNGSDIPVSDEKCFGSTDTKTVLECITALNIGFNETQQTINYFSGPSGPSTEEPADHTLADDYDFTCNPPGDDPAIDCTLVNNGPNSATGDPLWLLVIDGNNPDYWYLFDLNPEWNGTEDLRLFCFWGTIEPDGSCNNSGPSNSGAISGVYLFGDTTNVPEPGTLALLGLGLFGMGLMRKSQRSRRQRS